MTASKAIAVMWLLAVVLLVVLEFVGTFDASDEAWCRDRGGQVVTLADGTPGCLGVVGP